MASPRLSSRKNAYPAIPMVSGDVGNHTIALRALKEAVEMLTGVRGNMEDDALIWSDLKTARFQDEFGFPSGTVILIETARPLPAGWEETTFTPPQPALRYIRKML